MMNPPGFAYLRLGDLCCGRPLRLFCFVLFPPPPPSAGPATRLSNPLVDAPRPNQGLESQFSFYSNPLASFESKAPPRGPQPPPGPAPPHLEPQQKMQQQAPAPPPAGFQGGWGYPPGPAYMGGGRQDAGGRGWGRGGRGGGGRGGRFHGGGGGRGQGRGGGDFGGC